MGVYRDRVLPRLTDVAVRGRRFQEVRARVTAGLTGDVLEVGFGSGLNLPHYPEGVRRVLAVEPAPGGRRLAARRLAACGAAGNPVALEYIGLDGEVLPLGDAAVDHVLSTWTLCTIPDAGRALAEIRRVLRPGGTFRFAEHGLSKDPAVARWQDRLTPLQRRVAGGCHLNRPIDRLITGAGLAITHLEAYQMQGPKPYVCMYEGSAMKE